ncbi:196_t:CDS:2 [Racocetra persica]|uniref:196_t:CDS:1 n=1 Tax=Racocetra persica TaxID=160502 RepID=A0ACA9PTT7_9GLOM|nr:196_t:CDS:2 [Racocetra persica]
MALGKIFQNNRKTEPTSVFSLRLIVTALFGIILVGYSIFLILDICNDHPAIQSSFIETNSMPVPVLMISNIPKKSYLNCYFTYAANSAREDNKACAQYIGQPVLNTTSKYDGYFKTNGDLFFSTSSNEGLKNIGIMIYIDDVTYNASDPSMSIDIRAIDSDLERIPYITSMIESSLISNTTGSQSLFSTINIKPKSFIVQVSTSLGLFGGLFGLITSFYALLFGASAIKPLGLVQRHLFKVKRIVQDNLIITFESMPFISHLIHDTNGLKEDEISTEQLEKRLDLLQLFLRDYVVNVQYLEKIQQSNTSNIVNDEEPDSDKHI